MVIGQGQDRIGQGRVGGHLQDEGPSEGIDHEQQRQPQHDPLGPAQPQEGAALFRGGGGGGGKVR